MADQECGTGFSSDLTQAAAASGGDNYVGQCETALMVRRIWAIPMVAVGLDPSRRSRLHCRHRLGLDRCSVRQKVP